MNEKAPVARLGLFAFKAFLPIWIRPKLGKADIGSGDGANLSVGTKVYELLITVGNGL